MKCFLSLACLIACFQIQTSNYIPESISSLCPNAKKHLFGPLDIRKQGNSFIEGFLCVGLSTLPNLTIKNELNIKYISHVPLIFFNVSLYLKISNGESAMILSRIIGSYTGTIITALIIKKTS